MSVSTLAEPQAMTAEEFWNLPDNGSRQELVKGVLFEMPPAGFEHGELSSTVAAELRTYVRANDLGRVLAEAGFLIGRGPDTVRAPDCAFVARQRVPHPVPEGYFEGAPDLAVEMVSPHDRADDVFEKVCEWLEAGTRLVWVVHPRCKAVVAYRSRKDATLLHEGDTLSGEDVVPGFKLPVSRIFG